MESKSTASIASRVTHHGNNSPTPSRHTCRHVTWSESILPRPERQEQQADRHFPNTCRCKRTSHGNSQTLKPTGIIIVSVRLTPTTPAPAVFHQKATTKLKSPKKESQVPKKPKTSSKQAHYSSPRRKYTQTTTSCFAYYSITYSTQSFTLAIRTLFHAGFNLSIIFSFAAPLCSQSA